MRRSDGLDLADDIMDVWGGYDDFDSRDYIAYVMEQNAKEYREADTWVDARDELADQIICAMRALAEKGVDPERAVRWRLNARMRGNQDDIIAGYKDRYASDRATQQSWSVDGSVIKTNGTDLLVMEDGGDPATLDHANMTDGYVSYGIEGDRVTLMSMEGGDE